MKTSLSTDGNTIFISLNPEFLENQLIEKNENFLVPGYDSLETPNQFLTQDVIDSIISNLNLDLGKTIIFCYHHIFDLVYGSNLRKYFDFLSSRLTERTMITLGPIFKQSKNVGLGVYPFFLFFEEYKNLIPDDTNFTILQEAFFNVFYDDPTFFTFVGVQNEYMRLIN